MPGQHYSTDGGRSDRSGRARRRRRRLATAIGLVLVVVVVIILAFTVPGGSKGSTTTSLASAGGATSTSDTATETPAGDASPSDTTQEGGSPDDSTSESIETLAGTTYTADLGGGNEVPPLDTAAGGTLTLTVAPDGSEVDYVLELTGIISPTVARLHVGEVGDTGDTILTIYGGPGKSGLYNGTIAQGSFTAKKFVGPLKGKTIEDLVSLIESNSVYLNVGTESHRGGEIRGQVQPARE